MAGQVKLSYRRGVTHHVSMNLKPNQIVQESCYGRSNVQMSRYAYLTFVILNVKVGIRFKVGAI